METSENQYRELSEEYRTVLRLFWEIPSIVTAIVSGMVIGTYAFIPAQLRFLRTFLLFLSSFMMFIAFLSSWKHRAFGYYYVTTLMGRDVIIRHTRRLRDHSRRQNQGFRWRRLLEISVQKLFLVFLLMTSCVFLLLAFYELFVSMNLISSDFALWYFLAQPVVSLILLSIVLIDIIERLYRYFD